MNEKEIAYFGTNCMFTRVPLTDQNFDWEDAEVGTSEDYWEYPNADYDVEKNTGARIEYEDLPANLQE